MGGSGGGLYGSDFKGLEEKAKRLLAAASGNVSRHVFMSFAHEDLDEINLLRGQAKNDKLDLEFDDYSVKEPFDSTDSDYIKGAIRERIDRCSVALVYLTENSAGSQWVNWEIEECLKRGKGIIGVYKGERPPARLPPAFIREGCKIVKWEHDALMKAIEEANRKR